MRKAMLVLAVFGLVSLVWAADDPFVGTWKLNLEKSKFSPGPPPQSRTLKIEAQENGYKAVVNSVDSQGKSTQSEMNVKYDGKDYPLNMTGVSSDVTIATRKIDANTHESLVKQGGKEVGTMREVVSKDGKSLTRFNKSKNAQGQETNNTVVFDKQ